MPYVFISYCTKNGELAKIVADQLREMHIEYFLSDETLLGGDEWVKEILQKIDAADMMIVLLTPESVLSDYVLREVSTAVDFRKERKERQEKPLRICPLLIGLEKLDLKSELNFYLRDIHQPRVPVQNLRQAIDDVIKPYAQPAPEGTQAAAQPESSNTDGMLALGVAAAAVVAGVVSMLPGRKNAFPRNKEQRSLLQRLLNDITRQLRNYELLATKRHQLLITVRRAIEKPAEAAAQNALGLLRSTNALCGAMPARQAYEEGILKGLAKTPLDKGILEWICQLALADVMVLKDAENLVVLAALIDPENSFDKADALRLMDILEGWFSIYEKRLAAAVLTFISPVDKNEPSMLQFKRELLSFVNLPFDPAEMTMTMEAFDTVIASTERELAKSNAEWAAIAGEGDRLVLGGEKEAYAQRLGYPAQGGLIGTEIRASDGRHAITVHQLRISEDKKKNRYLLADISLRWLRGGAIYFNERDFSLLVMKDEAVWIKPEAKELTKNQMILPREVGANPVRGVLVFAFPAGVTDWRFIIHDDMNGIQQGGNIVFDQSMLS